MARDFAEFKNRYPELVDAGDANQPAIDDCLVEAGLVLGEPRCPKLADSLILAWAAHCVATSSSNPSGVDEGSGPVTSKSVGSVSVSYQVANSTGTLTDYYRSTRYGNKFLMYQKYCYGSGVMTAP